MKQNPYILMFGKEPIQMISRMSQSEEIVQAFLSEPPTQQICMITGVRGAGKTVLMTTLLKRFRSENHWVVVELNPAKDLLEGLAARLYNDLGLTAIFQSAKINLSFFGIGVEAGHTKPITDIEAALERMLENLARHKKKVLIAIDEAANTKEMRVFASAFQILIRRELPLFLLMTGLYENIDALQNEKILTFLHRAPKIRLKPLNIGSIAAHYRETFGLDDADARKMARLTRGYPFAFQVLGFYTCENGGDYEAALPSYRQYLEEYVYDKIWSELSNNDRRVICAVAASETGKVGDIRASLQMKANEFSPYRDRLIKKGLLSGDDHGYVRFTLPFFEAYAADHDDRQPPFA